MELTKLIEGLHPLETQVLPILEKQNRLQEVVAETKLSLAAVMRAFQWLENKKIVKLSESSKEVVKLLPNGTIALKKGLPEKIFLQNIAKKPTDIRSLLKNAKQEKDEFNACLGILKKSLAIEINKGVISITDHGKKLMTKESLEEDFLRTLEKPRETKKLNAEEKFALENLKNRKNYVDIVKIKEKSAELTKLGKKILSKGLEKSKSEDRLTTEMLKTGKWKNKSFRRYDVEINVPKIHGGKRHFVGQAIESAKRIWTDMGFKEMSGPIVNTSFWNFDALFTAQDHPVREMQDTYYLENPKKGKLPEKQVKQVKKAHEDGAGTGSKGWGNIWDKEQAKLNVLRTLTTVLSSKTLAKLKKV